MSEDIGNIAVDWRRPGPLTDAEITHIVRWYSDLHGLGDLTLSPFVSFWLDNDHEVFKRFRNWAECSTGGALTPAVGALLHLHLYVIRGYGQGALYQAVYARKLGVTKAQVLEVLDLGFLGSGPHGMAVTSVALAEYFRAWPDDEVFGPVEWPEGWAVDPKALDAGLDHTDPVLSEVEAESLRDWYTENQGAVPPYVDLMTTLNGSSLKAYRKRYEQAVSVLPAQLVPLASLFSSVLTGDESALARAAFQCRRWGVTRSQLSAALSRIFGYAGDASMDRVATVVTPMLESWPDK